MHLALTFDFAFVGEGREPSGFANQIEGFSI